MIAVARLDPAVASLAPFVEAGVLGPSEVHATATLVRLADVEADPQVTLALALAVRAPRAGHVCVELARAAVAAAEVDPEVAAGLPWPDDPVEWAARLRATPRLVAGPTDATSTPRRPLVLDGGRLYLQRLWAAEVRVATALGELAERGRLEVIVGGPGTGKTTTVARRLLEELARPEPTTVALAAPTGKAAARLQEVVRDRARTVGADDALLARLDEIQASTVHRLLGARGPRGMRRGPSSPLAHDLVVVDETSMVDLGLMADLVQALGPSTRLVLVGDPDQLASVEAGTVLADVVGPARSEEGGIGPLAGVVTVLRRGWRFAPDSGIAAVAAATVAGDVTGVLAALEGDDPSVRWIDAPGDVDGPLVAELVARLRDDAQRLVELGCDGEADAALELLQDRRVLCARRRGPTGAAAWNEVLRRSVGRGARGTWYPGQPVLVTRNDPLNRLANGDHGVVVDVGGGRLHLALPALPEPRLVPVSRLDQAETAYALTIHKSQGSEYDDVVVVLPTPGSPLATRELLFTGLTRARRRVTVVGSRAAVIEAVEHVIVRASGLAERLWRSA